MLLSRAKVLILPVSDTPLLCPLFFLLYSVLFFPFFFVSVSSRSSSPIISMSSASQAKHLLQNSLDMVAARSTLLVDLTQPSGTDNAWSMLDSPMLDSPTLGRMSSFIKGKALAREKPVPAPLSITVSLSLSSRGVLSDRVITMI